MRLEPFALERFQSIWENQVRLNISESGVHPLSVDELLADDDDRAALLSVRLGYPQTNGTAELRGTIAGLYPGATADHIQVTNGGSEANCVLLMRLIEPGDEIVFLTPNYMQIAGLARALGAIVKPWRLRETATATARRWLPDLAELRTLVTARTRAIILCNPNNPTGARLDGITLDAVCAEASRVGAWVIDDEIYRGAELADGATDSVWGRYDRAIVTTGLSKAYGLPGLRIGWIVAPPTLIADTWAVHDYTSIAPGAVNDRLARIALTPGRRADLLSRTRAIIRANYPVVRDWIDKQEGLSHIAPEAGAIAFVGYAHAMPSGELARRLRDEHSVLIVPGDQIDMEGYFRIGFGSGVDHLRTALTVIGGFLDSIAAHAR